MRPLAGALIICECLFSALRPSPAAAATAAAPLSFAIEARAGFSELIARIPRDWKMQKCTGENIRGNFFR